MVRIVLASVFVVSALVLGGCASGQKAPATAAATTHIHSAPIPGEMEFNFEDSREQKQQTGDLSAISFRANASERPSKGAVHAASN